MEAVISYPQRCLDSMSEFSANWPSLTVLGAGIPLLALNAAAKSWTNLSPSLVSLITGFSAVGIANYLTGKQICAVRRELGNFYVSQQGMLCACVTVAAAAVSFGAMGNEADVRTGEGILNLVGAVAALLMTKLPDLSYMAYVRRKYVTRKDTSPAYNEEDKINVNFTRALLAAASCHANGAEFRKLLLILGLAMYGR